MTRSEADDIIKSLQESQEFLNGQSANLDEIMDIIQPVFANTLVYKNESEKEMKKNIGEMMCGDQWAFIDLLPDEMDFEITESAKTFNDDQLMNSCEELSIKLNESTMGKFMWKIIAPFLKGHILYTPNDEFTKSIIEKVTKKI